MRDGAISDLSGKAAWILDAAKNFKHQVHEEHQGIKTFIALIFVPFVLFMFSCLIRSIRVIRGPSRDLCFPCALPQFCTSRHFSGPLFRAIRNLLKGETAPRACTSRLASRSDRYPRQQPAIGC